MINYNVDPTYLDFKFEGYVTSEQIKITDKLASHISSGLCPKLKQTIDRNILKASPREVPSEYALASTIKDILNNSIMTGVNSLDEHSIKGIANIFSKTVGTNSIFYQFIVDEDSKTRVTLDIDLLTSNIILIFNGRRTSNTAVRVFDYTEYIDEDFRTHITDNRLGGINQGKYSFDLIVPSTGWDGDITSHPYLIYPNNKNMQSKELTNKHTIITKILYRVLEPFDNPPGKTTFDILVGSSYNIVDNVFDDVFGKIKLYPSIDNSWKSDIEYVGDLKQLGYFRLVKNNPIGLMKFDLSMSGIIQLKIFYDIISS
jgi:hypothetical protein